MRTFRQTIVLILFSLAPILTAQTPPLSAPPTSVWPEGKMPGTAAKEAERDMPSKGDNVQRITNISQPTITVFSAPKKVAPSPAAIICPGGGYNYVVFDKEGTELATWLNSEGITAFVLKYRTPNNRMAHCRTSSAR